ncbi:MAG: phage recombination protein Bet [Clostridium sp.]|nr:phage recombination protein Bet [Clostridium sp.]MCM1547937.1 phage recombination protein Bet [Ruminococcus sp.]
MTVKNSLTTGKFDNNSVTFKAGNDDVKLSPVTVRNYLVSGDADKVTDQEIVMFINLCKYQGLNPFLREAYLIKYGTQPATIVTGKSAFEKRAARCEKYKGFDAGVIVYIPDIGLENRSGTVVLKDEELVGGWAEIYVEGYEKPVKSAVSLEEYMGRKKDGTVNSQWSSKPATMIRKVAKMQALREAFPDNFEGMYGAEEVNIDTPLPETPVENISRSEPEPQSDFADVLEG